MLARLPRPFAIAFVVLIAAIAAWCATATPPPIKTAKKGGYTDVRLYRDISAQVAQGVPYYQAAAQLQREHRYPLKPAVTVRPGTLVIGAAWIGWGGIQKLCMAALMVAVFVWAICLETSLHWVERIGLGFAIGAGGGGVLRDVLMSLHEYPAGLFLGIALAGQIGWPRKWWWVVLPAAIGLAVRELVLPFILLSLAFALWERRWREAAAWSALIACFGVYLVWHIAQVEAVLRPGDIASPGWHAMQGFSGFLKAVIFTSVLQGQKLPVALTLASLPLLGWLAMDGRRGAFAILMVVGYAVMIAAFSRPDTFYWGAIMLPWYFAGFALVPRALVQIYGALRGQRLGVMPPETPLLPAPEADTPKTAAC
ncbi:hypothetical protein GTZ99_04205 [Novosphingobium sp. FSY-8]|uniref:Uncharacterized protein n=1 Tax=Novosphingobium ovatum TaxID=1908523 RepID=A0ABW9XB50_9SPHN|nr:hypothetical protein [Novosphingobium ovatum]NBC35757.1 hypothetical protein [Novosphingobium ovatum]